MCVMYKCVYMYGVCIVYKCVWYMYCVCVVCECVLCVCVLYLLYISVCMWWVCIVYKYVYVHDIYIVYKCVFMFVWVSWSEGVSGHKETLFWPGALIVIHSAMSSFFPQAGWLTEHHENILFPTPPCLTPTPVWAPQSYLSPRLQSNSLQSAGQEVLLACLLAGFGSFFGYVNQVRPW